MIEIIWQPPSGITHHIPIRDIADVAREEVEHAPDRFVYDRQSPEYRERYVRTEWYAVINPGEAKRYEAMRKIDEHGGEQWMVPITMDTAWRLLDILAERIRIDAASAYEAYEMELTMGWKTGEPE